MFATILGALPAPSTAEGYATRDVGEAMVRAQEAAGLDPITDGTGPGIGPSVEAWSATSAMTDRTVKQAVLGPYTAGRAAPGSMQDRAAATMDQARAINRALLDLAAAGCPLIEVHEPAATAIGEDDAEWAVFREAQLRVLDGLEGTHGSLALTGGHVDAKRIGDLLAAPYASLALDLIAGPDNWGLVVATPGDRGIICGALSVAAGSFDGPEILLWAAGYAASTGGRGLDRVGLATASSLADLPWEAAIRKLERLGEAARLAAAPLEDRLKVMDPRAVSNRSAALGRVDLPPRRRPSHPTG